jgi:hypothetical protein
MSSLQGSGDTSQMFVYVLGADGSVLVNSTTGPASYDDWTQVFLTTQLPPSSALIRVRLVAVRATGTDNHGYFDDVGLYLLDQNNAPPVVFASGGSAPVLAPAAPPAPLSDRAGPITKIQTYYGYHDVTGELLTTDGIKDRTYIDTYQYQASKGEHMTFAVTPGGQGALDPRLSVSGPSGLQFNVSRNGVYSKVDTTASAAGLYTIRVSAADPARLGSYELWATGSGKEVRGNLDPFAADRDGISFFNAVDLTAENPGWYKIELWEGFHDGLLILRDNGYKDVARDDGSGARDKTSAVNLAVTTNLGSSTYHIIV